VSFGVIAFHCHGIQHDAHEAHEEHEEYIWSS
jgi:hypothetical protein